ncbi:hypothetical protein FORMB_17310 [Formosa sp. Hel1_33_131]|uniref:hypothetical protein n=1 Tax=Formosa sp. Hel1_33_131 TaxID=1336794 RepID=UPI00084E1625|nr:hypothetical protein [Formosa sp. Hel1_33_131]AOR28770.1 hypothetical protein FORMB_17310 [Formosa sp. Hel1_33_131]
MRRLILTFSFIVFCVGSIFSQELIKETDEFTGRSIERTKWEKLISKGLQPTILKYSILKEKDSVFFIGRIRVNAGKTVFAIGKGFRVIFKLDNGDTVVVKSNKHVVSRQGGANDGVFGSSIYGAEVTYVFDSNDDIEKLITNKVSKVRVYTDEGYFEKKVKSKAAVGLVKNLKLIVK